ncbi:MAG: DUF4384 domain-containing protein [Proteobacteria bacterium]|nr:DUF4384 domain-containing protein [Pseudomonadota bacterium]
MKYYAAKNLMLFCFLLISVCIVSDKLLYAAQSTITEAQGYACMGDDKSRKETEQSAVADSKRNAAETVLTHLSSETTIKNFELENDLVSAYSKAKVKIIQQIDGVWYKEASAGDCYKVKIKAEVIPDDTVLKASAKDDNLENPDKPLKIAVWTNNKKYRKGEKIIIYIKGNKPFYASVLYKDANGSMLQLLPNPYRKENYFNGGAVYTLPSGEDRYDLEVTPPFGEENIIVYASTSPLGQLDLAAQGGVYQVKTKDTGMKTRGVQIKAKSSESRPETAEFFEVSAAVKTGN